LAARIASVLVGCCFGAGVFAAVRAVGIIGVGRIEPRRTGCILIGPVDGDLLLGMIGNSLVQNLFPSLLQNLLRRKNNPAQSIIST